MPPSLVAAAFSNSNGRHDTIPFGDFGGPAKNNTKRLSHFMMKRKSKQPEQCIHIPNTPPSIPLPSGWAEIAKAEQVATLDVCSALPGHSLETETLAARTTSMGSTPTGATKKRFRRKRDPTPFNVLIVGFRGSGKTSFLKFLGDSLSSGDNEVKEPTIPPLASTDGFTRTYVETDFDSEVRVGVTLWDSRGFGPARGRGIVEVQMDEIINFIERKFDQTFGEENKVERCQKLDTHIHCVIYLLDPSNPSNVCSGLDSLDEYIITTLRSRAIVLPIIAKADAVSISRMSTLKSQIAESIKTLSLFDFLDNEDSSDYEEFKFPLSILSPEYPVAPGLAWKELQHGREYPFGFADVLNSSHCDFVKLREAIFGEWRSDMTEYCKTVLYESWRTGRLEGLRR
ncbi:Cell division control protein 11 [Neolecta irregularis DAH-3]|uniref:Cell division control protein 11 n=1 Tax=Neolecta irregularis (strain DAH-3) TaxID=1198029 RepID=A0A1U7LVK7_NEOID|nr:Cell division control protein 11 [Neolecta irregularis DAH-3]|eukprot:OLL26582.1 Cell division control protein 11 [Neolecta irregularis DAH-3]